MMAITTAKVVVPSTHDLRAEVESKVKSFLGRYRTYETENNVPLVLLLDKRSEAYYLICHLDSKWLVNGADTDAVLDPEETEDYKLNREIYTDNYAYQLMEADAIKGRSFEDIVIEYDTSYKTAKPLKVFGGQHRIKAIIEASKQGVSSIHGVRVYFDLSVEQRVNIAMVNNTSIAVSNDLLDRMQEEWLGANLRNWCQSVGLLGQDQNFADRRSPEGVPTVRVARTLVINFFLGRQARKDLRLGTPVICNSGAGVDDQYRRVRKSMSWSDSDLMTMGKEFTALHKLQRQQILGRSKDKHIEFANKAIHPCVAASWAYAAGYFQNSPALNTHYALPGSCSAQSDPLNADVLLRAKLKGVDTDAYRGLGARMSSDELGRMLQVFILHAESASKPGINKKLAEAAIKTYEAQKAAMRAEKALKGL